MPDQPNKNGSTPTTQEGLAKLGQDLLGVVQRMSEGLSSVMTDLEGFLTSSSTPTPADSDSPPPRESNTSPTLFGMDGSPASSSTSNGTASVTCASPNGFVPIDPSDIESLRSDREREVSLVVHFATFGNEDQARQASENILRILEVKGCNIISASHNGESIEPAEAS